MEKKNIETLEIRTRTQLFFKPTGNPGYNIFRANTHHHTKRPNRF